MFSKNLLVVGANSDLISPLHQNASKLGLKLLQLTRADWDLSDTNIPDSLIDRLIQFSPNHVLYAAGTNQTLDPNKINSDDIVAMVNDHLNINCISFLKLVLLLRENLQYTISSIHVISSLYGVYGRKGRLPYSLSKHALEGAIKCLALELPDTLVLGYRPGFFSTKLTNKNMSKNAQEKTRNRIPQGRLGEPSELSAAILNNIISLPIYSTGSFITMDGGLTAGGIFET